MLFAELANPNRTTHQLPNRRHQRAFRVHDGRFVHNNRRNDTSKVEGGGHCCSEVGLTAVGKVCVSRWWFAAMEPYVYHGRRGKETVFGISRANQTLVVMLAMVATMVCVLLWEASPFNVVHAPVLKDGATSEQSMMYESRPFLQIPPLVNKPPSEGNLPGLDVVDEPKLETEKVADTTVPVPMQENEPVATQENEPAATLESEPAAMLESEPAVRLEGEPATMLEGEPAAMLESEPAAKLEGEPATILEGEPAAMLESEPAAVPESIQRAANETLAEFEETSLAEFETALAESASHQGEKAPVSNPDDLILDADLDALPTGKPLEALSSEDASDPSPALAQETEVERDSSGKCDYSVGKWILDETRPLYSGLECNLWLAPGFSCRLNNHPDPLLDRYRWQPAGCDLPQFNATAALELLRNKVVAFVGDSLGRQQLQSLLCMLTRGKNDTEITDVGSSFGFYTPPGDRRPNGFAHRFEATNTTIIFKWTVTLARIEPLNASDPLSRNALHLDRPEQFLDDHIGDLDVLVLNSGHHWNGGKMKANRFEFYLDGKPVSEALRVPVAYNVTVHNVMRWVSRAVAGTGKVAYYRSLSPRHFRNGDWNTGGTCDTIRFADGVQVQEGNRIDPNAESAILGTNVNLLNITSLSLVRGETHVSKYGGGIGGQDCLHWCLPGIPDTWNEILFAELATKWKGRTSAN